MTTVLQQNVNMVIKVLNCSVCRERDDERDDGILGVTLYVI